MARDLFEEAIEAVLSPTRPMTLRELEEAVTVRIVGRERLERLGRPIGGARVLVLLRTNPDRFVEVSRGMWIRRSEGPDAGVRSPLPQPPLAGGAAAEAVPQPPVQRVDAVARPI